MIPSVYTTSALGSEQVAAVSVSELLSSTSQGPFLISGGERQLSSPPRLRAWETRAALHDSDGWCAGGISVSGDAGHPHLRRCPRRRPGHLPGGLVRGIEMLLYLKENGWSSRHSAVAVSGPEGSWGAWVPRRQLAWAEHAALWLTPSGVTRLPDNSGFTGHAAAGFGLITVK